MYEDGILEPVDQERIKKRCTDKLLTLQQKLKDVQEEKETKGPTTVNNVHCLLDQQRITEVIEEGNY